MTTRPEFKIENIGSGQPCCPICLCLVPWGKEDDHYDTHSEGEKLRASTPVDQS